MTMSISEQEIREFIIPRLAEAVNASGRYKRPECEGCRKVWTTIQTWFDDKEKERLEGFKKCMTK